MKMLKIKDNIPLEKLKDFGFIIYQSIDDGEYYYCICDIRYRGFVDSTLIESLKSCPHWLSE